MSPTVVGVAAGIAIGFAWIWFGPLNAFFLGLFILGGWFVAKIVSGQFDVLGWFSALLESRGRRLQ